MTWLTTIVRHRAIDQLRRSGSRAENRSISDEALLGLTAGEAYSADRGAELGALQRCLGELEPEPRRAVLLTYIYGLTHEELAARAEGYGEKWGPARRRTPGAVSRRIRYDEPKLREMLAAEYVLGALPRLRRSEWRTGLDYDSRAGSRRNRGCRIAPAAKRRRSFP
jgi:hypothetical protein